MLQLIKYFIILYALQMSDKTQQIRCANPQRVNARDFGVNVFYYEKRRLNLIQLSGRYFSLSVSLSKLLRKIIIFDKVK